MKIENLKQLNRLVILRRSVFVPNSVVWNKPRPAAWMINLSGTVLLKLFDVGMFVYFKNKTGGKK